MIFLIVVLLIFVGVPVLVETLLIREAKMLRELLADTDATMAEVYYKLDAAMKQPAVKRKESGSETD